MSSETNENLQGLLMRIRACQLCTFDHEPRPVVRGESSARILVVGQAPGRLVHNSGIPFDDRSGDRLREWMGVDRDTFYDPSRLAIVPMAFCYPGTDKAGDLPPPPLCAETWRKTLLAKFGQIEMTLVMGRYAIDWHLGRTQATITHTVRNWRKFGPSLIPLPHPSPRNNIWLRRNPWFDDEVVPAIKAAVFEVLANRSKPDRRKN